MTFICDKCRRGQHDQCPGGTWCDCLHRPSPSDQFKSTPTAQAKPRSYRFFTDSPDHSTSIHSRRFTTAPSCTD